MKKLSVFITAAVLSVFMCMSSLASTEIGLNLDWKYAGNSKINTGKAVLYTTDVAESARKGITVAVNAGHGTKGGGSVRTLCHPDGSKKVTGGSTAAGSTTATAVSGGMTFADGTAEPVATLMVAESLKQKLLADGYDVLMIRDDKDVQLDNIARTVIANNKADCHIAIHFDSTKSNKCVFFMSTPDALKSMEPVASYWQKHEKLGESLIAGLKASGMKVFSSGSMDMDLTQTSYSTVPSVDIEVGDKASDHSQAACDKIAAGLLDGINMYYGFTAAQG